MANFFETYLIGKLGLDKLPQERQEQILDQMGQEIQERVIGRVLEEMPEEDQNELSRILASGPEDKAVLDFLKAKFPNLEEIIDEEIKDFESDSASFLDALP